MAMNAGAQVGEAAIKPSQVRVGVHVRIPLPWMDHSFLTSAFVVTTEAQVREIAALGVDVFCDPRKSKVRPIPLVETPPPDAAFEAELERLRKAQEAQVAIKRRREAAMEAMRARLDAMQDRFVQAAEQASGAMRDLGARPRESVRTLLDVSEDSTRSLLADPDSTILMVTDKGLQHGEVVHAMSVMTLSLLVAKRLGLSADALRLIGTGALLHDSGVAALGPAGASLRRNPARNRHEEAAFQAHCHLGHKALQALGSLVPPQVLDIVLQHHEREDGKGYPGGKAGTAIFQGAKIVGIADRFDELTNPPDPTHALSPFEALAVMWTRERAAFNEPLLQHFIRAMGIYPPGLLVQLSDGRSGVVVAAAPESARLCPQVLVYDPGTPRRQAIIVDLAVPLADAEAPGAAPGEAGGAAAPLKIEKALRMQDRSDDELDYLLPRRQLSWFKGKS